MRAKNSAMFSLLLIAFGALFTNNLIPVGAKGIEAKILLESAANNKESYKLNSDVLEEISQLQGPIRVIAAVGNENLHP